MNLDLIFNSLSTAIIVFNDRGECVYANESSQSLLHHGVKWFDGRCIEAVFKTQAEIAQQCRSAVLKVHQLVLREVDIPLPDWQRSLLVDIVMTPYDQVEQGGFIIEIIDRKDVKKLAQDTDKLERFKAATRVVRGLCHEIKNPLGGIRGAAQLLEMEGQDAQTKEYTQVITQEVDRLTSLLDRMSSGGQQDKRIRADIHEPITQVTGLLKVEYVEAFELSFDFDTSLPPVEINFDLIKQALLNLVQNAVQWAISDNKTNSPLVLLRTRAAYPDVRRSLMPEQGIRIQIQDNGPGVDQSVVDQLFLPMVTRREGGTGLGLVISQEIVQNHGGFIELDERSHLGASFSVYLPYLHKEKT